MVQKSKFNEIDFNNMNITVKLKLNIRRICSPEHFLSLFGS